MKLYNTLSRKIEEFEPINPEYVGIYTCGPTVYREIHIGNLRTYLTTDLLRRTLAWNSYQVRSVMNITDVGHMRYSTEANKQIDPILYEADQMGISALELSAHYTKLFLEDIERLHILPQDVMPKATEYIPEMIEIIKILIDKKYAYESLGNVYFDVKKFKDYGKLSGNTLDKMDQLFEAVRVSVETDKKDSIDFALWKKAPEGSVMKWESPWGEGVPGWHIECSAMSIKELGDTFDIHAGGEDLIFPHHEDEIAQSEAATGTKFVNYWVHTNFLLVDGEKMSRSKRNVFTLKDLQGKRFSPRAFRYLTFQTHYRSRMNFTWEGLKASQTALDKLYSIAAVLPAPDREGLAEYEFEFQDAINNDLNMAKALAVMWEMLRSKKPKAKIAASLARMDEVLGLNIFEAHESIEEIPQEVLQLLEQRDALRRDRKFSQSDHVRAKIEKMGYVIEDGKGKSRVVRKV
jgi:cysteinyl-tRNA synthetase